MPEVVQDDPMVSTPEITLYKNSFYRMYRMQRGGAPEERGHHSDIEQGGVWSEMEMGCRRSGFLSLSPVSR